MGIFISELLKYGVFLYIFLKKRFYHFIIVIPIFLCVSGIFSNKVLGRELPLIISTFYTIIAYIFLIKGTIKEKIESVLVSMFFIFCMDQILLLIGQYIIISIIPILNDVIVCYFINNITLILFIPFFDFIRKKCIMYINSKENIFRFFIIGIYILSAIIIISLFMVISAVELVLEYDNMGRKFTLFFSILAIFSFISLACVGIAFRRILFLNKQKDNLLQKELQLREAQKKYYEAILEREEETKKFRHDMKNHFICLEEILEYQTVDKVKEYMDHMQEDLLQVKNRIYQTGNIILDSMLNYYLPVLKEEVEISVIGNFNGIVAISDLEFCTIISNLIQNAIEELKRLKEQKKIFQLYIEAGKEYVQIIIINTTNREYKKKELQKLPETTKEDKKNHGMGLFNVKKAVEKCNGIFEWDCNGERFQVKLILPLK